VRCRKLVRRPRSGAPACTEIGLLSTALIAGHAPRIGLAGDGSADRHGWNGARTWQTAKIAPCRLCVFKFGSRCDHVVSQPQTMRCRRSALRVLLLQAFYTVRSERLLIEQLDYDR
jgi:hypothetical protein